MTKTYEKKSSIALFKNTRASKPTDKYQQPDYNAKITLVEDLKAGEYEANVYFKKSKAGLDYMQGNIRVAKPKVDNYKAKESGYQSETEIDDIIPF